MKNFEKLILAVILVAVLVLPLAVVVLSTIIVSRDALFLPFKLAFQSYNSTAMQKPGDSGLQVQNGDQLVLGGTYELKGSETLDGSLVVIGGVASLQSSSQVEEDVVLMGGTLQINGTVAGDVVSIGGMVDLGSSAVIKGDVNVLSGNLQRAEGALIEGRVNQSMRGPYSVPLVIPNTRVLIPSISSESVLMRGLVLLFKSILWAIVALLFVLLLPNHSERARRAVVEKTGVATGLGLLTAVVAPLLLVVFAFTIIGIPVSLLGMFGLMLGWIFGVIIVGLEVGKRLVQAAKQEWAPAVMAALGTFLVTLLGNVIGAVVPCIGWMVPSFVGILGLGAVLITRFGTQDYQPYGLQAVESVQAEEPPVVELPVEEIPPESAGAVEKSEEA